MSRQDYTAEQGPSWVDVEKAIDHIEQEFAGTVLITIQRHTMKGNVRQMLVLTEFRVQDGAGDPRVRVARRCWWDRREFRTITAVLYNQLLGCDSWLTSMKDNAERQATLL